jgi:hypothetical protein
MKGGTGNVAEEEDKAVIPSQRGSRSPSGPMSCERCSEPWPKGKNQSEKEADFQSPGGQRSNCKQPANTGRSLARPPWDWRAQPSVWLWQVWLGPWPWVGTVEPVDGLLPQAPCDTAVNTFVLVALILQEVLQEVQHFGHLQKRGSMRAAKVPGVPPGIHHG